MIKKVKTNKEAENVKVNEEKPKKVVKKTKTEKEKKEEVELEVVSEVKVRKVLQYKYPKGMTDTVERKSYRQKVRNEIKKAQLKIAKFYGSGDKENLRLAKEELKRLEEQYMA